MMMRSLITVLAAAAISATQRLVAAGSLHAGGRPGQHEHRRDDRRAAARTGL